MLTIMGLLVLAWLVPDAVNWLFIKAVWSGADRTVCATTEQLGGIQPAGWSGACWPSFSRASRPSFSGAIRLKNAGGLSLSG